MLQVTQSPHRVSRPVGQASKRHLPRGVDPQWMEQRAPSSQRISLQLPVSWVAPGAQSNAQLEPPSHVPTTLLWPLPSNPHVAPPVQVTVMFSSMSNPSVVHVDALQVTVQLLPHV